MKSSLNSIFRTIWSEALGAWIAVSEITKTKGKRTSSSLIRSIRPVGSELDSASGIGGRLKPIVFAIACCFAINAHANPLGGQVINGQATFNTTGNTLTVTNTPGTIINWQGFSINSNEVTHFAQQSAASTVLNRVITNNPSAILGTLSSNGRVFLVNPSGIFFGSGSTVDVAGLVATSLNLSNADFLAGRHNFTAVAGAQNISNAGNITAQQNGQIYLIAPNVENTGIINAPNGEILLVAGHSVELVNELDPNLRVNITAPAGDATNIGQLVASSGALGLFGTVVRNSGIASADSATMQGGKIVFRSSQRTEVSGTASAQGVGGGEIKVLSDMQQGTVEVSGMLDASAPVNGNGGFIDTSAAHVQVREGARISTLAPNGVSGKWLIDPTDFYVSVTDPADGSSWMDNVTLSYNLGFGNITIQTLANGAGNGDIFVNDAVGWSSIYSLTLNAYRDVNINAVISNAGTGGLRVRTDLNGTGTGTINFGGGSVTLTGGTANFYYNPTVFGTQNNYSANVTGGTLTEWMLVNNATNLQAINTNLAGNYALGRNVDASSIPSFVPLGNTATNFTGQFDGFNHTISNLSVTQALAGVGLFGEIGVVGTVKGVGLVNVSIHGTATTSAVGGLAGINRGTISNSYVDGGTVIANNGAAGGLVGRNLGGAGSAATGATPGTTGSSAQIDNSFVANVAVSVMASGAKAAGGLIGINQGGLGGAGGNAGITIPGAAGGTGGAAVVSNSYVVGGSVSGMGTSPNTGGLVGLNQGGNGGNGGNDSGITAAGGIGGTGGLANVNNSYASSGAVSGTVGSAGGLIGSNLSGLLGTAGTGLLGGGAGGIAGLGSATTVAWDSVTSVQAVAIGGGNQDTVINISATPYSQASYTGFDFTNTWWMSEGNTRPFLRSEYNGKIGNSHQLQLMVLDQGANYTMSNDIDMTASMAAGGMWSSAGFVPIGYFSGSLDGQGFAISGLIVNRPATADVGLFSILGMGSSVKNLGMLGGSVIGNWRIGGLAGTSDATISNCYVSGMSVSEAGASTLGGLVGQNGFYGSIVNSYVTGGTVTGSGRWIGGLAGLNYGVIDGSHVANSTVNGGTFGDSVAGLVGWNASGASITNSYVSNGNVSGRNTVGGLVGWNTGTIGNSYISNGNISGVSTIGGLVGYNSGSVDLSYASAPSGSVSGSSNVGGLVGFNGGSISNSYVSSGYVWAGGANIGGLVGSMGNGSVVNSHYNIWAVGINDNWGTEVTPGGLFNAGGSGGQFDAWLTNNLTLNINNYSSLTLVGSDYVIGDMQGMKDLLGFADNPAYSFRVASNTPIVLDSGYYIPLLAGNFDGGVNSPLSGLNLNLQNDNQGLFGQVASGVTVSNVTLLNANVNGSSNVGALVGWNKGDIVGSSSTLGTVSGNSYVGGLVGINENPYLWSVCSGTCTNIPSGGNISNSFVSGGSVSGSGFAAGGLIGHSKGGSVVASNVSNLSVSGLDEVGGLVGSDGGEGAFVTITTSNADTVTVSGNSMVGGLVGFLNGDITGSSVTAGMVSSPAATTGFYIAIGGLVGRSNRGTISNSYASSGTVVNGGSAHYVGGLVGDLIGTNWTTTYSQFQDGLISNSYVSGGTVSGDNSVGGLVGRNQGGTIENSFVAVSLISGAASIGGSSGVGGLAGTNNGNIANVYISGGTVSGINNVGGLVGANSISGNIGFGYADVALVTGIGNVGGVLGYNYQGAIGDTFWNTGLLGANLTNGIGNDFFVGATDIGAGGLSATGLKTMSNFTGWSIANTGGAGMAWRIYEGQTGPLLTSFLRPLNASVSGSRVYDGTTDVSGLVTYLDGQANPVVPDANLITANLAADTSSPNVGTYSVTPSGLYSTQLGYDISYTGGSVDITTAGVTLLSVTAANASKVYGTTYNFAGTEFTPIGLVGGDTISGVTLTSAGAVATANAGNYAITPSNAVFSVGSAANYTITYVNGTLTVTPKQLSISGSSAANKVYDGTVSATVGAGVLSGLVGGETLGLSASGAFINKNVGTAKNVLVTYSLTDSTGLASNYSLPTETLTADITALPVTLTVPSLTKTYDGGLGYNMSVADIANLSGALVGGDVVNAANITFVDKNAGTGKTVLFNSVAINDGNGGGNYSISLVGNSTSTINQENLIVVAKNLNKVLGTPDPALGYLLFGLHDPVDTTLSGTLTRVAGDTIGAYSIDQGSVTLLDTTNYYMTYVPGVFRILAPTVVQEITQTAVGSNPDDEEKEKQKANELLADATTDDSGLPLATQLPVCQ